MNNKFYQVVVVTVFSALAQMSSAENYSSEFSGRYLTADIDAEGQKSNVDQFGISQQVFFSEVDTSVGPLGKAAFISRASSYTLGYSVIDGEADTDIANVAIDWRDNDMGLTLGLDYSFTDTTSGGAISDELVASVGFYVAETTEISFQYAREKYKQIEAQEKTLALSVSHVGTGDVGFAIEGSFSMADTLTDNEQFGIAVSAAVYPTSQFGIGAGFDVSLADEDDDRVFAFAEWFFKPNLKAAVTYSVSDQDNIDTNAFILDVSFRL
jgi:hypothetical protein